MLLGLATTIKAQEGYHVAVNYKPEHIEILPNLYELFDTIVAGPDRGKPCYALSVNAGLIAEVRDSLEKGVRQVLYGPKLEKLVQQKIIEDYRQVRLEIEQDIQEELAETEDTLEKKKLKVTLKLEKKNTKNYLKRLKEITARYSVRAIYVYGRASVSNDNAAIPNIPDSRVPAFFDPRGNYDPVIPDRTPANLNRGRVPKKVTPEALDAPEPDQ